jgi:hypothetical protein
MPRSTSIVMSRSVTSTVPFIGVLMIPIFAAKENVSVDPCQLLCCSTKRTGSVADCRKRSFSDRSIVCMTSSRDLLCGTVIRIASDYTPVANNIRANSIKCFLILLTLMSGLSPAPLSFLFSISLGSDLYLDCGLLQVHASPERSPLNSLGDKGGAGSSHRTEILSESLVIR